MKVSLLPFKQLDLGFFKSLLFNFLELLNGYENITIWVSLISYANYRSCQDDFAVNKTKFRTHSMKITPEKLAFMPFLQQHFALSFLLKGTKFWVKISQFEFFLWQSKAFLFINFFLSLNILNFSLFFI